MLHADSWLSIDLRQGLPVLQLRQDAATEALCLRTKKPFARRMSDAYTGSEGLRMVATLPD